MGIFKKFITPQPIEQNESVYTTKDINLGDSEAENDRWENNYFLDCFDIFNQLDNNRYLFIGRKGTGKSAIVKYLQNVAVDKPDALRCWCNGRNSMLLEKELQQGNHLTLLYEWIILVSIGRLILDIASDWDFITEISALKKFYRNNAGIMSIDQQSLGRFAKESERSIRISPIADIGLKKSQKRELENRQADFYRFIPELRSFIIKILQMQRLEDINFLVMFDDLDLDYKIGSDEDKKRILELIRITRDYNTSYLKDTNARILLFLRDDIKRSLEGLDTDTAKIFSSSAFELNWYNHEAGKISETDVFLRQFINRRIESNLRKLGIPFDADDPWTALVYESEAARQGHESSMFKRILDLTFYRPRDLILFFKSITTTAYPLPLRKSSLEAIEKTYLEEFYKEICSELAVIFSQFEQNKIGNVLSTMADAIRQSGDKRNCISYKNITDILHENSFPDSTLDTLINYGLIIPKDNKGKFYSTFRETKLKQSWDKYVYILSKPMTQLFSKKSPKI